MKLKIGLDLDDTVNSWYPEYLKMFGAPKNNYEITKNVHNKLKNNDAYLFATKYFEFVEKNPKE